jgi:hypothetical protein
MITKDLEMYKKSSNESSIVLVAVLSAFAGGLTVAIASRMIPKMMSRIMAGMMQSMMSNMGSGACAPEEM